MSTHLYLHTNNYTAIEDIYADIQAYHYGLEMETYGHSKMIEDFLVQLFERYPPDTFEWLGNTWVQSIGYFMVHLESQKLLVEDWMQIIEQAQAFGLSVFDNLNRNTYPPL